MKEKKNRQSRDWQNKNWQSKYRKEKKRTLAGAVILMGAVMTLGMGIAGSFLLEKREQRLALAYGESTQRNMSLADVFFAGADGFRMESGEWETESETESESGSEFADDAEHEYDSESVAGPEYESGGEGAEESARETRSECGEESETARVSGNEEETGRGAGAESGVETGREEGTEDEAESRGEDGAEREEETGGKEESEHEEETDSEDGVESEEGSGGEEGLEHEEEPGNEVGTEGEEESGGEEGLEREEEPGNEAGTEREEEAGCKDGAESEEETGSEAGTEREEETGCKDGAESEEEAGSEVGTEREEETGSEAGTEREEETGREDGAEREEETGSEEETEGEVECSSEEESESEIEIGGGTESDSEEECESEDGDDSEEETESEEETGCDGETGAGNGEDDTTDTEKSSEVMTESEETGETDPPIQEPPQSEGKPEKIFRGQHYEIVGDQNAWYRDDMDHLWIRAGSNLYIETKKDGGYGSGPKMENLQQDGTLTFSLKKLDEQGEVLAESEIKQEDYFVDGEAPEADIVLSGIHQEGIVYSAQSADAEITVAPDGKSGLRKAVYSVVKCQEDGTLLQQPQAADWRDCAMRQQVNIQEEGIYQIYVRTEDNVGNLAFSKSGVLCVDATSPEITVDGVGDQTANSGSVRLRISSRDSHYKKGTTQVEVAGVNQGRIPVVSAQEENDQGAMVEYFDFPMQQSYDDIYHLSVQAEDIAGNKTEKVVEFSVNRFGSVYDLSPETKKSLGRYFLTEAKDIVFYETNIDYVGESKIYCRRDGDLRELKRGDDYQVEMQGNRNSWKRYQYTVPAGYFEKEGVYELLLSSNDRAQNQSDTGMQQKQVAFVLDWTSPECTITGVEEQQAYEAQTVTAVLTPHDNIGIRTMRVYHDSELLLEKQELLGAGETVRVPLEASESWQTLQVYLSDMAGNEFWSREIPIYVNLKGEAVPEYRRLRPSAKELAQKGSHRDGVVQSDGEEGGDTQKKAGAAGEEHEKTLLAPSRRAEGIVILTMGIIMLGATVLSCYITGIGRKK